MSTSLSLLNNSGCIIFSLCVLIYVLHCLLCLRCRRNRVSATGLAAGDSQAAGNAGLNQSAIDLLPSFAYHDDKCAAATEECAVCLSHVEEGEMVRLLQCGHAFHMACVDVWLHAHALCPLCRAEAKPPEEKVAAGGDRCLPLAEAV